MYANGPSILLALAILLILGMAAFEFMTYRIKLSKEKPSSKGLTTPPPPPEVTPTITVSDIVIGPGTYCDRQNHEIIIDTLSVTDSDDESGREVDFVINESQNVTTGKCNINVFKDHYIKRSTNNLSSL